MATSDDSKQGVPLSHLGGGSGPTLVPPSTPSSLNKDRLPIKFYRISGQSATPPAIFDTLYFNQQTSSYERKVGDAFNPITIPDSIAPADSFMRHSLETLLGHATTQRFRIAKPTLCDNDSDVLAQYAFLIENRGTAPNNPVTRAVPSIDPVLPAATYHQNNDGSWIISETVAAVPPETADTQRAIQHVTVTDVIGKNTGVQISYRPFSFETRDEEEEPVGVYVKSDDGALNVRLARKTHEYTIGGKKLFNKRVPFTGTKKTFESYTPVGDIANGVPANTVEGLLITQREQAPDQFNGWLDTLSHGRPWHVAQEGTFSAITYETSTTPEKVVADITQGLENGQRGMTPPVQKQKSRWKQYRVPVLGAALGLAVIAGVGWYQVTHQPDPTARNPTDQVDTSRLKADARAKVGIDEMLKQLNLKDGRPQSGKSSEQYKQPDGKSADANALQGKQSDAQNNDKQNGKQGALPQDSAQGIPPFRARDRPLADAKGTYGIAPLFGPTAGANVSKDGVPSPLLPGLAPNAPLSSPASSSIVLQFPWYTGGPVEPPQDVGQQNVSQNGVPNVPTATVVPSATAPTNVGSVKLVWGMTDKGAILPLPTDGMFDPEFSTSKPYTVHVPGTVRDANPDERTKFGLSDGKYLVLPSVTTESYATKGNYQLVGVNVVTDGKLTRSFAKPGDSVYVPATPEMESALANKTLKFQTMSLRKADPSKLEDNTYTIVSSYRNGFVDMAAPAAVTTTSLENSVIDTSAPVTAARANIVGRGNNVVRLDVFDMSKTVYASASSLAFGAPLAYAFRRRDE